MKFSRKVGNGPLNKWLNFGGDSDHRLDTGIVFRIRHYWEIRKVVNGHKSAADIDSPNGGTGKTCLGGGMHCRSASSQDGQRYVVDDIEWLVFVHILYQCRCTAVCC